MKINRKDLSISFLVIISSLFFLYTSSKLSEAGLDSNNSSWIIRIFSNLFGYSAILLPGYIILKYVKRSNYDSYTPRGFLWPLIRDCVYGSEGSEFKLIESHEKTDKTSQSFTNSALLLIYCFCGLQISYLTWGVLQEKIITTKYDGDSFKDSQFLVFINRIFGLVFAGLYINLYEKGKGFNAPLYKFSYCAFSNIMSSWFQYEALKFVSFPLQVLAKTCKIIPVMLMGKVVSKKSFEFYEYLTALLISLGMILFLSGSSDTIKSDSTSSPTSVGISGIVILILYMAFDSFTSNWQSELFSSYAISPMRMMCGVNVFSLLLTGASLVQQGTLAQNATFLFNHSDFALDCFILTICSAVGQLFIYYTIEKFGPVVFIIIMSIRQAIAVVLSCIFFNHPISAHGIVGVLIVFFSLFLRIYCSYRIKQIRKIKSIQSSTIIKI